MTKYQRLFPDHYQISTKDYVRIYKLFMQNKANFRNDKMNINALITIRYGKLGTLDGRKNKAKTNPIKANTKPIKANAVLNFGD